MTAEEAIENAFDGVIKHAFVDDGIDNLEVLGLGIFDTGEQVDVALLTPGLYPKHHHEESTAKIYILKGEGDVMIGDETFTYKKGSTYTFPQDEDHGFVVRELTSFLSIQDKPIMDKEGNIDFHRRNTEQDA